MTIALFIITGLIYGQLEITREALYQTEAQRDYYKAKLVLVEKDD
jgi:hypothetical protein